MKTTKTHCLLRYLYYIALFTLAYFLVFFVINKYNETQKIEEFTGGSSKISKTSLILIIIFCLFGFFLIAGFFGRSYQNKIKEQEKDQLIRGLADIRKAFKMS